MLRFLSFATLFLVAICLVISASIALASERATPAQNPHCAVLPADCAVAGGQNLPG